MQDAEWIASSRNAGVPAVFEYNTGGALVFNYFVRGQTRKRRQAPQRGL